MKYKYFLFAKEWYTKRSAVGIFESLQRKDANMDDMQVYIMNLGKYNEGEFVGACRLSTLEEA